MRIISHSSSSSAASSSIVENDVILAVRSLVVGSSPRRKDDRSRGRISGDEPIVMSRDERCSGSSAVSDDSLWPDGKSSITRNTHLLSEETSIPS